VPVDSSRSSARNRGASTSKIEGNWVIILGHGNVVSIVSGVSRCRYGSIARLQSHRIVRPGVGGGRDTVPVDNSRTGARDTGTSISDVEGNWVISLGHGDLVVVVVGGA
jgi:hypothetical protein